jgi:rubrerythrin
MTLHNLRIVLSTMTDMISLERMLATLYATCGAAFPEDRLFWLGLADQEEQHAESIERLLRLVSERPEEFEVGRPFTSAAIQTIKAGISGHIEAAQRGRLTRDKALFICRDIENSVLESSYRDIVKSGNVEFKRVIEAIVQQTLAHKSAVTKKIASLTAG